MLTFICVCFIILVLIILGLVWDAPPEDDSLQKSIDCIIHKHKKALLLHYRTLLRRDEYGNLIVKDFKKKIKEFITNVLLPDARFKDVRMGTELTNLIFYKIINMCEFETSKRNLQNTFDFEASSPKEYEQLCVKKLETLGWKAQTTQSTGDQGADVIAEKYNTVVAIQCKKYSGSVGNKAVQEVIAGMKYYSADFGCVVTNSKYTISAKRLATASNIFLLHHSQLDDIDNIIFNVILEGDK